MNRFFLGVILCVLFPFTTEAYVPLVITPQSVNDIRRIENPEESQIFYAQLADFPHMYEINVTQPFALSVRVLVPDTEEAKNTVSGIVLRKLKQNGVEEVARLRAKQAAWGKYYEPVGGDTYREGSEFTAELEAGDYLIEMSTPDNLEPYAFVIGTKKSSQGIGYFELLGRIIEVKKFFGKPWFMVIESPLVYVPLVLVLLALVTGYILLVRRRVRVNVME